MMEAYDKVEWDYLEAIMGKLGVSRVWISSFRVPGKEWGLLGLGRAPRRDRARPCGAALLGHPSIVVAV